MQTDESGPAAVLRLLANSAKKSTPAQIPSNEGQLLMDAQGSDMILAADSIGYLLGYYEPKIVTFIRHIVPDTDEILDVWQRTTQRVVRRLRRPPPLTMAPGKTFAHYLYRVAHNTAKDALIDVSKRTAISLDQSLELDLEAILCVSSVDSYVDEANINAACLDLLPMDVREGLQRLSLATPAALDEILRAGSTAAVDYNWLSGNTPIVRALAQLPPKHRSCVILHDWFGVNFRVVGEIMGVAEKTASFNAWAGRERMRAILAREWWEEDGYSQSQIAEDLNISETAVPGYVKDGQRLYERDQKKQGRGELNVQ